MHIRVKNYQRDRKPEPVFLNVYGAPEFEFRQPI